MSQVLIEPEIVKGWQRYPAYKDSGVGWLGEIPAHWEVKRLKHLGKINLSNVDKKSTENEDSVKLCNYVDVYYNDYITKEIDFLIATASHEQKQKFALKKGDVLLTKDSETWNDIAIPACVANDLDNVICGYHIAHIRPYQDRAIGEYIFRSISSTRLKEQFWVTANGVTRFGISKSSISDALLTAPPLPEQKAIAHFLDEQTAKIDTLIAKKERLIELLKEKRAALISHAVTKGLNPDVAMKDSGVKWLGEIPAHWEVKPLKWLVSKIGSGKTPKGGAEVYSDTGVIFLRSQNIHFDGLRLNDVVYIDDLIDFEMASTRVFPFDILLNITGASLGRCSLVPNEFLAANVNQHVCIIRPIANLVNPQFLNRLISSNAIQRQIFSAEDGVSREGLTFSQVGNLMVGLPKDIAEQQAIAQFLDEQTAKIDTLIAKTRTSIDKLKEYRTALISAAVTGKIKVVDESGSFLLPPSGLTIGET